MRERHQELELRTKDYFEACPDAGYLIIHQLTYSFPRRNHQQSRCGYRRQSSGYAGRFRQTERDEILYYHS